MGFELAVGFIVFLIVGVFVRTALGLNVGTRVGVCEGSLDEGRRVGE